MTPSDRNTGIFRLDAVFVLVRGSRAVGDADPATIRIPARIRMTRRDVDEQTVSSGRGDRHE